MPNLETAQEQQLLPAKRSPLPRILSALLLVSALISALVLLLVTASCAGTPGISGDASAGGPRSGGDYPSLSPSAESREALPPWADMQDRNLNRFSLVKEYLSLESGSSPVVSHTILPWKDGKAAACSITFDDGTLDQYTRAFPLLETYNIKGSFYILPGLMDRGVWQDGTVSRQLFSWDQAREIALAGHELGSHGMFHRDLGLLIRREEVSEAEGELGDSAEILREKLTLWLGKAGAEAPLTFCWPFWRSHEALEEIARDYYLGARGGTGVLENYLVHFESAPSEPISGDTRYRIDSYGVRSFDTLQVLEDVLDTSIQRKGWSVLGFHGFRDQYEDDAQGWDPVDLSLFGKFLQLCLEKDLWIAPFRDVLEYQMITQSLQFEVTAEGASGLAGFFTAPSGTGRNKTIDISFQLREGLTPPLVIDSRGEELPLLPLGNNRYRIQIIPNGGEYALIAAGRLASLGQHTEFP